MRVDCFIKMVKFRFCEILKTWSIATLISMYDAELASGRNQVDAKIDPCQASFFQNTRCSILPPCSISPRLTIQKISNKISRSLGIMNRLKRYLPQNILSTIYNSLILPHTNYSILVWVFQSSRISKLQKRAVHMISCSKYNAHTETLFKSLNLLKIGRYFQN